MPMPIKLPNKIFVTGTGTDVGKTVVSAILASGLSAKYWKPIQCGMTEPTDREWVQKATKLPSNYFFPETYCLKQPLSPHAAAEYENVSIRLSDFEMPDISEDEHLIIEGAGGIMVPINDNELVLDLIIAMNVPVLIVSANILGTINHTLLTLEQLKRANVNVLGVVLNGDSNSINKNAIEKYGNTTVIAEISTIETITPESLKALYNEIFC